MRFVFIGRKILPSLAFIVFLFGNAILSTDADRKHVRAAQEDNIREAVFRYVFLHNASGLQQNAQVFCLSVNGRDPTAMFMSRFRNEKPRVLRSSECAKEGWNGVRDRETGEEGLLFDLAGIYWYSDDEVFADGSYYSAPLSAAGYSWRVLREGSGWIVKSEHMHWIS
jgi:hypothetical protein